ncbi:MAG TPA: hypothetical protein VHY31_08770, partial [Streptosporangiaceae bacterium]|nr:hypothetical protein [Streptosporangiaceae bacterium]
ASLIESMTVDFDPDEYHDGYREALQELVNAKVEGREVIQPEGEGGGGAEPTSLADALKASLAAAQGPRQAAGEVTAEAKAPRRAIGGTKARSGRSSAAKDDEGAEDTGSGKSTRSRSRRPAAKDGEAKDGGTKTGTSKPAASKGTRRRAS